MSGWVTSNLQYAFNSNLKLRSNIEYTLSYSLLHLHFQAPSSFPVSEVRPVYDTGACPAHLLMSAQCMHPPWQPASCSWGADWSLSPVTLPWSQQRHWQQTSGSCPGSWVECNLAEIRGDSCWNTEIRAAVRSFWFIKNMSRASERKRVRQHLSDGTEQVNGLQTHKRYLEILGAAYPVHEALEPTQSWEETTQSNGY